MFAFLYSESYVRRGENVISQRCTSLKAVQVFELLIALLLYLFPFNCRFCA